MTPAVSVLIVSWKVRELLAECLDSLAGAARGLEGAVEVIVVDNASGDGTVEMLRARYPGVALIANPDNRGFAAASNQAFAVSTAPVVVLLNPDTRMHPGSLEGLVKLVSGSRYAVAGPRLLNTDGSLQRWTAGGFPTLSNLLWHYLFLDRLHLPWAPRSLYLEAGKDHLHEVDWLTGACMAVRRDCLDGQLFDEQYFLYSEDMALCHRLRQAGHRIVYAPEFRVTHHLGRSLAQQTGEVSVAPIRAARRFFGSHHGRTAVLAFDAITGGGFLLRAALYACLSLVRRDPHARLRARTCLRYAAAALRLYRAGQP
jgi:GT2 family glycosyltransferase